MRTKPRGLNIKEAIMASRTRDDAAVWYAVGISNYGGDNPCWTAINHAIISRWSESGLEYIKRRAWQRLGT